MTAYTPSDPHLSPTTGLRLPDAAEHGVGTDDQVVRVSKLMAGRGMCSRREADRYIEHGWVLADGIVVTLGTKVHPSARIVLTEPAQQHQQTLISVIVNKPVGFVSTQPEPGYTPAITLVTPDRQFGPGPTFERSWLRGLSVAGRLDIESQGLLLFTQDGRLANHIIGDAGSVDKEYLVRVTGRLGRNGLERLRHGLELDEVQLRPALVEWLNDDQLRFVLREGRKRQIRRMCTLVGLDVIGLKRVRIGNIRLGNLPEGHWRLLGADERV